MEVRPAPEREAGLEGSGLRLQDAGAFFHHALETCRGVECFGRCKKGCSFVIPTVSVVMGCFGDGVIGGSRRGDESAGDVAQMKSLPWDAERMYSRSNESVTHVIGSLSHSIVFAPSCSDVVPSSHCPIGFPCPHLLPN